LVTAEHATNALPSGYSFSGQQLAPGELLAESHWAYDPYSLAAANEFAAAAQGVLVAAAFSRLFIDPNRPLASDTLVRRRCGGAAVALNVNAGPEEVAARVGAVWSPFHLCLGAVKAAVGPAAVLSVHTFNVTYPDMPLGSRDFEVGVLNTFDPGLALDICAALNASGIPSRVNEPYSGQEGIMFSAEGVAGARESDDGEGGDGSDGDAGSGSSAGSVAAGRVPAIMLEFRNDVCAQPGWRKRAVAAVWPVLKKALVRP
jgi:predicted N-formylglutamate amidohydrolase